MIPIFSDTSEAYNLGLESFEAGLFSPLTNIVTLYVLFSSTSKNNVCNVYVSRDLSYNNLVEVPSGTFTDFQRLSRLCVSVL